MKLSEKTLSILKSFSTINPSIKINQGSTLSTISPTKNILAKTSIEEDFEKMFCIYDLPQFLATLSMLKDAEIELRDSDAVISSGRQKVVFRFADESMIKVTVPSKEINFPNPEVSFELKSEDLSSVIKATGVLGLPEIAVAGEDGKLYIRAINTKDVGTNKFDIELGETDQTFVAVIKPEYLSKLISGNYQVDISSKLISRFTGDDITYWVCLEADSSSFE